MIMRSVLGQSAAVAILTSASLLGVAGAGVAVAAPVTATAAAQVHFYAGAPDTVTNCGTCAR
jgi:hypothetical protein